MSRARAASLALATLGAAFGLLLACSHAPSGESGGAGTGGGGAAETATSSSRAVSVTSVTASSASSASGAGGGEPHPGVVPANWVRWTGWDEKCPFWLPPDEASLPAPIEWEPCAPDIVPGAACQKMKTDWAGEETPIAYYPKLSFDDTGKPLLMMNRVALSYTADGQPSPGSYFLSIVGEVDGPLRFAVMQPRPAGNPGCAIYAETLNEGRFAFNIRGEGVEPATKSPVDGPMLGKVGDLVPTTPYRNEDDRVSTWYAGGELMVRDSVPGHYLDRFTPDGELVENLWDPAKDPEGLVPWGRPVILGSRVLFGVGSSARAGIMAYDGTTLRPLVRNYGSSTDVAGNVGSDGKHLVWTRGQGEPTGVSVWGDVSIMVSPFTTDPDEIQPKRLRKDPYGNIGGHPFAVGCGFAGHTNPSPILVRLSDGQAWILPDKEKVINWATVLGFTCEEAFILGHLDKQGAHIFRIRLDSLGPGLPPD